MLELSNQECRDLPGSLSNRGCYFDKDGKPTEYIQKAVSCSCLDCGLKKGITQVFSVPELVKGRKVFRPVCPPCNMVREGQ